jgi:serine/threonine protein kinase/regulator of sirC expression with transglutaminase-like and TPR domain
MSGQLLDGRYEIVKVLGGGAFGKTFLAKDVKRPGQPKCVVKQLIYSSQEAQGLEIARRLFKTEAQTLEKLGNHDQIPTLLAEFEENQEFYLVQQFVDGYPLNQEIQPGIPWSEDKVISLLTELLQILKYVHSYAVIHRDIKPSNLMRRSSDNKIVLIDFGAVKEITNQISQGQSPLTVAVGTLQYMPMEQLQGQPRFNSDIYAVGMLGIQALSGLHSNELSKLRDYNSPNKGEILWRNRAQVSAGLAQIIDKMVLTDCNLRYQSATEVLVDLGQISLPSTIFNPQSNTTPVIPTTLVLKSNKARLSIIAGVGALIAVGVGVFGYNQLPQTRSKALYHQGLSKSDQGDKSGAVEDFTQAIGIYSQNAEAFYQRANIRFSTGDFNGAIADSTQAIQINPYYGVAYTRRCAAYINKSEHQKAEEDCTQALGLNSNDTDAYLNRGAARLNLGKTQEAIEDLTQLIKLSPNDSKAYLNRGVAQDQLQNYQAAIEDFNQALRLNPKYADAYNSKGITRFNLQENQGAIEDLTKAVEIKPDFADGYRNRGLVYAAVGDKQKAIQDFQQAGKLYAGQGKTGGYNDVQNLIKKLQ